ncbi:HAMP domain-containing sensor histidine kinase [uncultured Thermanaerothrix sp.]|uniref:sensor histidine kinase n=1 Tax=uncultured Thermanaerothrix sp. TaxID=1195149 RepID=UPI00260C2FC9|nr:HAMP domain-containing sensor histidine kinase [uncultured Thermanaerothrix sp.]
MSLRLRLTLLYTSLFGGVLLLVGGLVYILVSQTLLSEVDSRLERAARELIGRLRVNAANQFDQRAVIGFQPLENLFYQVWDAQGRLQVSRPPGLTQPLDPVGLNYGQPIYRSILNSATNLRVLSVPLRSNRGPVGVLQVALSLDLLLVAQRTLAILLVIMFLFSVVIVGLGTWLGTGYILAPLQVVTEAALQITRADDLSRRIPLAAQETDVEFRQLITAFNTTLERLETLFNAQRRFLADVSHELRTPLTVIKGEIGLMRLTGTVDPESLQAIDQEVDRLTRLVGDLLLMAQAEAGSLTLERQPVSLDNLLLEVVQQMQHLAEGTRSLRIVETAPITILGDKDRLKQVLLNLVGNAIKYTPPGGEICLGLRREGNEARIRVSDSGPGIPEEDLPHIFERFYRGRGQEGENAPFGYGLGLAIAQRIVQSHGGWIEVESRLGQGTTFIVRLPLEGAILAKEEPG